MSDFLVNAEELGARIRDLRLRYNKTQNYFADLLYISASYLALIEAGKRIPNLEVLVQITKVTDVSLDYLVFGTTETDKPDIGQKILARLRRNYSEDEILKALRLAEYGLKLAHLEDSTEEICL